MRSCPPRRNKGVAAALALLAAAAGLAVARKSPPFVPAVPYETTVRYEFKDAVIEARVWGPTLHAMGAAAKRLDAAMRAMEGGPPVSVTVSSPSAPSRRPR